MVGLSIHSQAFQNYLKSTALSAIKMGTDALFLDEIQTSSAFISKDKHGAGFGKHDLNYFDQYLKKNNFKSFYEFISKKYLQGKEIDQNTLSKVFKIKSKEELSPTIFLSAKSSEFKASQDKFLNDYKLGSAIVPGIVASFPKLELVSKLRKIKHENYLALMYSEAIASGGNWAVGYWSDEYGWPEDTLNPDSLIPYSKFYTKNSEIYERPFKKNKIAVVYNNQSVIDNPKDYYSYVGLVQILNKLNIQFDVIFTGDNTYDAKPLNTKILNSYELILYPNARSFTDKNLDAVKALKSKSVFLGDTDPKIGTIKEQRKLSDLGVSYLKNPEQSILNGLDKNLSKVLPTYRRSVVVNSPSVLAQVREKKDSLYVHLINQDYNQKTDKLNTKKDLPVSVSLPKNFKEPMKVRLLSPGKVESELKYRIENGMLKITVPDLNIYSVISIKNS